MCVLFNAHFLCHRFLLTLRTLCELRIAAYFVARLRDATTTTTTQLFNFPPNINPLLRIYGHHHTAKRARMHLHLPIPIPKNAGVFSPSVWRHACTHANARTLYQTDKHTRAHSRTHHLPCRQQMPPKPRGTRTRSIYTLAPNPRAYHQQQQHTRTYVFCVCVRAYVRALPSIYCFSHTRVWLYLSCSPVNGCRAHATMINVTPACFFFGARAGRTKNGIHVERRRVCRICFRKHSLEVCVRSHLTA